MEGGTCDAHVVGPVRRLAVRLSDGLAGRLRPGLARRLLGRLLSLLAAGLIGRRTGLFGRRTGGRVRHVRRRRGRLSRRRARLMARDEVVGMRERVGRGSAANRVAERRDPIGPAGGRRERAVVGGRERHVPIRERGAQRANGGAAAVRAAGRGKRCGDVIRGGTGQARIPIIYRRPNYAEKGRIGQSGNAGWMRQ